MNSEISYGKKSPSKTGTCGPIQKINNYINFIHKKFVSTGSPILILDKVKIFNSGNIKLKYNHLYNRSNTFNFGSNTY